MVTSRTPEPLDAAALRSAVTVGAGPWRRLDVVSETGSTNADLLARATTEDGVAGAVLLAEFQTAGRGRHGRNWVTPLGAQIAMSVGVDATGVPSERWGWLPLLTGVALVDTLAEACNVDAGLKWPNDVLVGPDKLAGVLAEVAAPAQAIVVGLGLNVSLVAEQLPTPAATSLALLGVSDLDRNRLVALLLTHLGRRITRWRACGGADTDLIADYRRCSRTIGTRVRALLPGGDTLIGTAVRIDDTGRLHIDDGTAVHAVSAGDITHLRPE
jgi:BirA family transcriptional regulator, biotin operon repressor / biotin---[acetyl-CoA-carboxylase] ligase